MADTVDRTDLLTLDIDLRLSNLWKEMDEIEEWDLKSVAAFVRAAYGKGYYDALEEDADEERGKLCLENGYRSP